LIRLRFFKMLLSAAWFGGALIAAESTRSYQQIFVKI